MVVPTSRLLWWAALVGLPFSLLGAVEPRALTLALGAMVVLAILAIADALGAGRKLRGLGIELIPVTRMSKDRATSLEVRIRNETHQPATVRLGLDLPRAVGAQQDDHWVNLPAGQEWSRLGWPCTPIQRGRFLIRRACLEAHSSFGFWAARREIPAPAEIRVYPNLFADRRNLAALFLHRGTFGLHAQRQVGKGREFEKLREYIPGDGYEDVHWKATAKRGRPITKVFQIERTQEIYVILDASRLSSKPTAGGASTPPPDQPTPGMEAAPSVLERFITAGLVLGLAAEQQGDLFGLVTFSSQVRQFLRARNGKAHYSACREALYTLQPQEVTPDFDELCTFLRLRLRRRALLVFLTSLDDPALAESFVRNVDLLRRQHLVLVNMIQPGGVGALFSEPDVRTEDDIYQRLGGHLAWHNLRELEKVLQRRGVQFSMLRNERLTVELVAQYLSVKRRQAL